MKNKIAEHRKKVRRERIINIVREQYRRQIEAREEYLKTKNNNDKTCVASSYLWTQYIRRVNECAMFRYGIATADPDGKWNKKFNDIYDEVEKEYETKENS